MKKKIIKIEGNFFFNNKLYVCESFFERPEFQSLITSISRELIQLTY